MDMRDDIFQELVRSTCYKEQRVRQSYLASISDSDRLHLCVAAQKRNSRTRPLFLDNEIAEAELFDIVFADNKVLQRVAVRCTTSPTMVVLFQNLRINKDVMVIFVENEDQVVPEGCE